MPDSRLSVLVPQVQSLVSQLVEAGADMRLTLPEAMALAGPASSIAFSIQPLLKDRNLLHAELVAVINAGIDEAARLGKEKAAPFLADKLLQSLGL